MDLTKVDVFTSKKTSPGTPSFETATIVNPGPTTNNDPSMTIRNSIKFRLQIEIYLVDLEQCNYFFMGDGTCHELNNKPMCDYDGWDCLKDCHLPQAIGDGFCDTLTNSEECVFDGGDCCLDGGMDDMFTFPLFNNCIPDCKFIGYFMIQCNYQD